MMSQSGYVSSTNVPKITESSLKKDWNEYQRLATQGRYIKPKLFSGFHDRLIRLTTVKRKLYRPRLPSIRPTERDEVLCRLADEHCRHSISFPEEKFQNFDPKREESCTEFSGLNWHDTGKALLGVHEASFLRNESSLESDSRLRSDKPRKDSRFSQAKLYRSSSLYTKTPSATPAQLIQYGHLHPRNNAFNQSSGTPFHLTTRNSFKSTEGIFRSSSMYVDESAHPWIPIGHNDGYKSSRI